MQIIKKYVFSCDLRIYFFFSEACVCLVSEANFIVFRLPAYFFFKFFENGFSFLFLNYFFFKNFINSFILLQRKFYNYFFFRMKIKGLGYRFIRLSKSLYRFFFISTNFFYLHLPKTVMVKLRKRRLLFLGSNLDTFRIFVLNLLLLKGFSAYRPRGITYPRRIVLLKPGKKRF